MANGNNSLDWRAVGVIVTLLVGMFTLTNFLTNDKIDSKVQKHEIATETKHNEDISDIKEDLATVTATQRSILNNVDRLEQQNKEILKKLDRMSGG